MGVGKVTRVIDAASQHVQGVDMVLSRVSAIGSALADLIASRWLEPTGMAEGLATEPFQQPQRTRRHPRTKIGTWVGCEWAVGGHR